MRVYLRAVLVFLYFRYPILAALILWASRLLTFCLGPISAEEAERAVATAAWWQVLRTN